MQNMGKSEDFQRNSFEGNGNENETPASVYRWLLLVPGEAPGFTTDRYSEKIPLETRTLVDCSCALLFLVKDLIIFLACECSYGIRVPITLPYVHPPLALLF